MTPVRETTEDSISIFPSRLKGIFELFVLIAIWIGFTILLFSASIWHQYSWGFRALFAWAYLVLLFRLASQVRALVDPPKLEIRKHGLILPDGKSIDWANVESIRMTKIQRQLSIRFVPKGGIYLHTIDFSDRDIKRAASYLKEVAPERLTKAL